MEAEHVEPGPAETGEPLVVFSLDDQRYAVALSRVERAMRVVAITPLPKAPAIVLGIIDLAGVVIAVVDLRRRFGHPPRELRLSDHLVIARAGKRTVALLVDSTDGVLDASLESHAAGEAILPGLELVAGAVKLESGLVLIHDLERLLSLEEEAAIDRVLDERCAAGSEAGAVSGGPDDEPQTGAS